MKIIKFTLLITVTIFHLNAGTFNINYNLRGSFSSHAHMKEFQSLLVHDFEFAYSPKDLLSFGMVLSNDHSFNMEFKNRRSFLGYGPSVMLNFPGNSGTQINLNCKYIYFGYFEQKTYRNNKLINSKEFTLQELILCYGITMYLNQHFGIKFGYNLFLYKTGFGFRNQFYGLQGFYAGLNCNFKILK
jgi:hypothetical protein